MLTKNSLYLLSNEHHHTLIPKAILKKYKIDKPSLLTTIDIEAKSNFYGYNIQEETEHCTPTKQEMILKKYKNNFLIQPKVSLICPSKSDIDRLSQNILDRYIPIIKK